MFTDKLAATIGPSYVGGFFAGGFYGFVKELRRPKPKSKRPFKLTVN